MTPGLSPHSNCGQPDRIVRTRMSRRIEIPICAFDNRAGGLSCLSAFPKKRTMSGVISPMSFEGSRFRRAILCRQCRNETHGNHLIRGRQNDATLQLVFSDHLRWASYPPPARGTSKEFPNSHSHSTYLPCV